MKHTELKYLGLTVILLSVYATFFILQPIVDYSSETLYDGKQYLKIVEYFSSENNSYLVNFPFNSRIGIPYLVSFFPSPLLGFTIVNGLSLIAFFSLLSYFLTKYMQANFTQLTGVLLWLSLHFAGPLRYYIHDPMSIDLPIMVLEGLVVLAFFKKNTALLFVAAICGIFIKESMIALLVLLIIASILFHKKDFIKPLILTLICTIVIKTSIGIQFPMAIPNWKYNSVITLLFKLKFIALHPIELLQWSTSLLFVGGLFSLQIKKTKALTSEQKTICMTAIYGLVISMLGGEDYARLLFTSSIFIFSVLIYFTKNTNPKVLVYLIFGSLPFLRITDILTTKNSYLTFPEYFDALTCCIWLGYFIMTASMYAFYKRRKKV